MIMVACEECGINIKRWPSQLKVNKYGPFCNLKCLGKFRTRKLVGDYAANFKSGFKRDRLYIKVICKWHPFADKLGYVYLHRLIFEAKLGRYLNNGEHVHHTDGDSTNNHWSNLESLSSSDHSKIHNKTRNRNNRGEFK